MHAVESGPAEGDSAKGAVIAPSAALGTYALRTSTAMVIPHIMWSCLSQPCLTAAASDTFERWHASESAAQLDAAERSAAGHRGAMGCAVGQSTTEHGPAKDSATMHRMPGYRAK